MLQRQRSIFAGGGGGPGFSVGFGAGGGPGVELVRHDSKVARQQIENNGGA